MENNNFNILSKTPEATMLSRRRSKPVKPFYKRDARYIDSGNCLFVYNTAAPPWTIFAFNLGVNFWLILSLSTFDWNFRYQLLIGTFGVEIWLKHLIETFAVNFWLKLLIVFRCQLLIAIRCQLLITAELSNLRQHVWIQTDSCRRFDSKVAV